MQLCAGRSGTRLFCVRSVFVGPTGHIIDKTSMMQHVKTDIGLDRLCMGKAREEVGREEKDKS